jgi:aspartyl-tRNA(Asn)/glutamyl-tRNA(Gln) amidotransferase subunit A
MAGAIGKPLAAVARLLRDGKLAAEALAEEAIARQQRYAHLNAYKTFEPRTVLQAARAADAALKAGGDAGPLHGIPVSVKDLYGVAGYPTFAGSPKRLPEAWEREGPVMAALRRQMGVVTGKSHTVEFAFGGLGTNPHWGTPRNPWGGAEHRIPGGSSSGAGVSLGQGSAMVALGSDTGGSVRLPATFTGNAGLKVTIGRWSTDGIVPLSPSMDTPGPLARTVADVAYAFAAFDPAGHDANAFLGRLARAELSGVRIGVCDSFMWDDLDPGIGEAAKRALDDAARKGARIVKIDFPEMREAYEMHLKGSVLSVELKQFLDDALPAWKATLEPIIQRRVADGGAIDATEYIRRLRWCADKNKAANARLAEVDVIAMPTSPLSPPRLSEVTSVDGYIAHNRKSFRFTCGVNLLALCALSMPVGLNKAGLPVGLQLVSRSGNEERLLEVAFALERAIGTGEDRMGRPPLDKASKKGS